MNAILMPAWCSRDLAVIKVELPEEGGGSRKVVVASAYFSCDSQDPLPTAEAQRLIQHCQETRLALIIGCDANSHHTAWGCSDINSRGEALLESLASSNLIILNRGSRPTFRSAGRETIIDLTLCSQEISHAIRGWREGEPYRNPRRTDWALYRESLNWHLEGYTPSIKNREDCEEAAAHIRSAITQAYEASYMTVTPKARGRGMPWWTQELQRQRAEVRRALNKACFKNLDVDEVKYKELQRPYKYSIAAAQKKAWRDFCENIESGKEAARLSRLLAGRTTSWIEAIQKPEGHYADSEEECLQLLLDANFHRSERVGAGEGPNGPPHRPTARSWEVAKDVVRPGTVAWAIDTFGPFKSPGTDGIFPALLQKAKDLLIGPLVRVFRASIACKYIPLEWRTAKVVFIRKASRVQHVTVKDLRPISLTSFVLKTLEKVVDRYLRDRILQTRPLHPNQHAYRAGYSTESALHAAVAKIEPRLEKGGYAVGIFMDIEGAFNHTPPEVACREALDRGIAPPLVDWMDELLRNRKVEASLGTHRRVALVDRGCPPEGVLSPLIWCLVADSLLRTINGRGCHAQAYADYVLLLTQGTFLDTAMDSMQLILKKVDKWCSETGLTVNPAKTELVIFTRKHRVEQCANLTLRGSRIEARESAKYLGIILDRKLKWKEHTEFQVRKFCTALWACRRAVGVTHRRMLVYRRVKTAGLSGAGYYRRADGRGTFIPLGRLATVFQTEIMAILGCSYRMAELVTESKRICSDSQAALRALDSRTVTSRLVWECKKALGALEAKNTVRLIWVPGHMGIKGNEIADRLANLGSRNIPEEPEPIIGLARSQIRCTIMEWTESKHKEWWSAATGCRQAKAMLGPEPNSDWLWQARNRGREYTRLLTHIITGHGHLRYHGHKIGLVPDSTCRWCSADEETPLHRLTACDAAAERRRKWFGDALPSLEDIRGTKASRLIGFWKEVVRTN
ncbi:unnamed protein product [Trichogramma brassicae]|uniref:RNase H type-1 domain-containing protein n=1 Tax=Trichogramma brassicae TaxID=86971 RepID=A0A6H5INW1_9HYME|nr:unnamed protein product [Trichogramma brassicae]